jgi:hypothetical protein
MTRKKLRPAPARGGAGLSEFRCRASFLIPPTIPDTAFQAAPKRRDEARIQAAIVEWIRTVAPDLIAFHPANGGLRGKAEAARLKWIGVLAGVPDIVILGHGGQAWLIECKTIDGTLSAEQRAIRARCVALGIPFGIARSIDDARDLFATWKIETRESAR